MSRSAWGNHRLNHSAAVRPIYFLATLRISALITPGHAKHRPGPLVERITQQLGNLSEAELLTSQDFVDYLIWKHHGEAEPPSAKRSAEVRAIDRISDLDDPTQWVTVIDEGEEVDVEVLHQWLIDRGFQIETPD
ncbi:hypothetical protein ACQ4N7_05670 [Nodosilinea sp. AN01ver1]|uniref:hypothetical protein n=1 Tax=Nodosilinea sp. AN01ver1 TaxID=3423362 RepID=UPI003D31087C